MPDTIVHCVAKATVSVLYVKPTFMATTVCPHCGEANFVEISNDQQGKTIKDSCLPCGKDYIIELPDYSSK